MFSPAARKPFLVPQKERRPGHESPSTPLHPVPGRPTTGTPAPWASRLSVLARANNTENSGDADQTQPVHVGEFPQVVRNAQANLLRMNLTDNRVLAGGMDKGAHLTWMICGTELFIWNYLSASVANKCIVLEVPSSVIGNKELHVNPHCSNQWMVCVIRWNNPSSEKSELVLEQCVSAGIILCNPRTQAVAYWPDIYSNRGNVLTSSLPNPLPNDSDLSGDKTPRCNHIGSIIAAAVPGTPYACIAMICWSNGELWLLQFAQDTIQRKLVCHSQSSKGSARSLIWLSKHPFSEESGWCFLLLMNHEVQCWSITFEAGVDTVILWTHEIVGDDGGSGIKKDLAGQKYIWLLDMQIDDRGKDLSILVATLCKDRASSSSYIEYSLLTMEYKKPNQSYPSDDTEPVNERFLEKKAPLQVIIPKARFDDEKILFSMRLRVGGKPSGSAIVLSGDGTATVAHYWRGSTRLYQFDLPWDAGKVLDASVFPSAGDTEEGAWVVLTEKAGVWAIPEKAVLLGGVEPPERSLSRKGSSNERTTEEEKRNQAFGSDIIPRRASFGGAGVGDGQTIGLPGLNQQTVHDDEAETLLGQLFHDFLMSGGVEGALERLQVKGAFEKDGETNVFARMSKSIVDTLAKHWTTTRGADFVASAVVSSLLLDKRQKHQKYLEFLVLSKCHEELSLKQRYSMLYIMEHGEKLAGAIQLRELQSMLGQQRSNMAESPHRSQTQASSSLWNLIQLVGEKARRNTVLLMDRDNAEVFYSKVSAIEEIFYCLSHYLQHIIVGHEPFPIQIQRALELSNACTTLIQTALHYRDEHRDWYPPPEGLTPWNSQPVVRSGLWSIASCITELLKESGVTETSTTSEIFSQLEGLTDILLEAYTGSITAKIERGEAHKALSEEYCKRRDELLQSLYEFAKRVVQAKYSESCRGTDDPQLKDSIYREVTSSVLQIAKRHEGYQTLWCICCDLNDKELLRNLMMDGVGPHGGFSYFVFEQLIKSQQYAKLLRIGEEFPEELAIFLKDHKDLLWLHEIFLNRFSSASETLHALALSVEDDSVDVGEYNLARKKQFPSLAERKRLLYLSKIAAVAGKDASFEMKIGRIEADLQILKLQEDIVQNLTKGAKVPDINKPLPPTNLIELCLKGGRELSLKAFEVFSWTSSSFRIKNRRLLEDCWRNAADQDDWLALSEASRLEGWSDEVALEALRRTVLFSASKLCYGSEAEIYDGTFEEVLPLQKGRVLLPSRNSSPSVEEILMQHKDFPEADKLMLTAVMMGREAPAYIAERIAMDDA